jgi:hypothetical protein
MSNAELNERFKLMMAVKPPVTTKCHPSSFGEIKSAQLPVRLKFCAVIGVGVFGSSGIWYELPLAADDPVPALITTKALMAAITAPTPASRHPLKRAVLLDTDSLLGPPYLSGP